jgi:adenine/guanine phosphoribosyltransferase-like PRPP-binding protein
MPADGHQVFVPDRRGGRLERYSFVVPADRRSHRLWVRASPEIVGQFLRAASGGLAYKLANRGALGAAGWTHCLEAPGLPDAGACELAELLSEVITLPRLPSGGFSIAMDWYKVPDEGVDPDDWRNTPDGQRVHVGKYWLGSPEAMAAAGRALADRLTGVVRRHPLMAAADAVVAVPGHDRTYVSFGEQLAATVGRTLGLPLVKVRSPREFRPPAKNLAGTGTDAIWDEFFVDEKLTGVTALIVDDVFRTGKTMSAVGSAMVRAGAAQAYGLVAVRTLRR